MVSEIVLLAVLIIAVGTDLRTGKIKNWLTFPAIISGPLLHFVQGGTREAALSLAGMGVMVPVAVMLVWLAKMGGGDVKLLIAVGSLVGLTLVKNALLYTALTGGVVAILILIKHRGVIALVSDMGRFVWGMFVRRTGCVGLQGGKVKFPYSVPIAIGTALALFLPLWRP